MVPTVKNAFSTGAGFYKIVAEPNGPTLKEQGHTSSEDKQRCTPLILNITSKPSTDGLQHIFSYSLLDESAMAKIKSSKNIFVTPTMEVLRIAYASCARTSPPWPVRVRGDIQENVRRLFLSGAPIVAKIDSIGDISVSPTGAFLPFGPTSYTVRLENFVGLGMTPAEAIRSAVVMVSDPQ
ncbi:hypothetical protein F5050DRAFT_1757942 [Lentinula boryana]|uniref:Uncharacterized protein n=1 Tax=Lentinula boryana TaxID=40481 RepID=A0ABQ8QDS2_9AGAR|nr:hypothetical protein F5050DRAFT_1757942 [Lentinula boryana]